MNILYTSYLLYLREKTATESQTFRNKAAAEWLSGQSIDNSLFQKNSHQEISGTNFPQNF